jgi:predicted Rossmann-fold nucleotide-binding protein
MKNVVVEIMRVWLALLQSGLQMTYGLYRLSKLVQPRIAVFGGKGAFEEGKYATLAQDFAQRCVEQGMSIITGGGPGIMAAANCGAQKASKGKPGWGL